MLDIGDEIFYIDSISHFCDNSINKEIFYAQNKRVVV